ncbi:zinc finger protein 235-like [Haliotis asinina]|uniref:zinc finger protein 235-like n=1 Tax=Haliotis asinina TaxID=109174 RepID=UPI003531F652
MEDAAKKMKIKQEVQHVHDNLADDGTNHDSVSRKDRTTIIKTERGTGSSPLHDCQEQVTDKHSSQTSLTVSGTNEIVLNSQQSVVIRNGFTQEKNISASETDHTRVPQNSIMAHKEIAIKLEHSDNELESESIEVEKSQYHETDRMNSGDSFMRSDSSFPSEAMINEEDNLPQVTTNQGKNVRKDSVVVLPSVNKTLNTEFINKRNLQAGKEASDQLSFQLQKRKPPSSSVVVITPETIGTEVDSNLDRGILSQRVTSQNDQSDEPLLKKIKQEPSEDPRVHIMHSVKPTHGILRCVFCGSKFAQIVRFRHHMKTHCERKPIMCGNCDNGYYFLKDLHDHFRKSHWKEVQYSCSVCPEYFRSEQKLATHLTDCHPADMLFCGICGLMPKTDQNFLNHLQIHTHKPSGKCGVCLKLYTDCTELELHLKQHFEQGQYMCTKCNQTFKTAVEFSKHAKLHCGVNPFPCEQCGRRFRNKMDLHMHVSITHIMHSLHVCELCNTKFSGLQQLKNHMHVHTKYECHFCGDVYNKDEHLKSHMKTHTVTVHYL